MMVFCILTLLAFSVCYASSPVTENEKENNHITSPNSDEPEPVAPENYFERKAILKISVSEQGTIEDITIIQGTGIKMLDDAAIYQMKKWHFGKVQENGKAIAYKAKIPLRFQMEDDSLALLDSTAIKHLQQKLNELGFDCGEPNGIMDSKTEQAIRDFQQSKGLKPDGILWSKTKKALGI